MDEAIFDAGSECAYRGKSAVEQNFKRKVLRALADYISARKR